MLFYHVLLTPKDPSIYTLVVEMMVQRTKVWSYLKSGSFLILWLLLSRIESIWGSFGSKFPWRLIRVSFIGGLVSLVKTFEQVKTQENNKKRIGPLINF